MLELSRSNSKHSENLSEKFPEHWNSNEHLNDNLLSREATPVRQPPSHSHSNKIFSSNNIIILIILNIFHIRFLFGR